MKSEELNESEFLNKNYIKFGEKIVQLPYNIARIIKYNESLWVMLAQEFPLWFKDKYAVERHSDINSRKIWTEDELSWISEYLAIMNTNIWCFDLEGNLKAKFPEAYPETNHQLSLEQTGHRLVVNYTDMCFHPSRGDVIIGFTGYGYSI